MCLFVDTDAALGSRRKNPFDLKHFNLTTLEFSTNSEVIYTLRTNFSQAADYACAYHDLFKGNFGHTPTVSPNISMFEYANGYFMVVLQISQPLKLFSQNEVWSRQPVGSLTITGRFEHALKNSVEFIYMGSFFDNLFITKRRATYLASQRFRDSKAAATAS
mgnify:CR=1 FL=1